MIWRTCLVENGDASRNIPFVTIGRFFLAHGSGPGPSLGFQGQNLTANPSFGSVWSDRAGPASYRTGSMRQNGDLTRHSGQLRKICPQIRYLRKKLGYIAVSYTHLTLPTKA